LRFVRNFRGTSCITAWLGYKRVPLFFVGNAFFGNLTVMSIKSAFGAYLLLPPPAEGVEREPPPPLLEGALYEREFPPP